MGHRPRRRAATIAALAITAAAAAAAATTTGGHDATVRDAAAHRPAATTGGHQAATHRPPARAHATGARRHVRPGIARLLSGEGPPGDGMRVVTDVPVGRSAGGRPIVVTATGAPAARRHVLAVGCIHGVECAGIPIVRQVLVEESVPARADVWLLPDLDPDGRAAVTRLNGHGVDLNRNFPAGWRPIGRPWDLEYSGPRPFSEPETRTIRAIVRSFHPTTTIWFHQQAEPLVRAWGASVPAARRYARLVGLPFRPMHWLAGTAPHWQNTAFPGTASFVVELPLGRLTRAAVHRHAAAVLRLAHLAPPLATEGQRR